MSRIHDTTQEIREHLDNLEDMHKEFEVQFKIVKKSVRVVEPFEVMRRIINDLAKLYDIINPEY